MSAPTNRVLRFELDGATYRFDQARLSIAEARLVKRHTGWGFALWDSQIQLLDPDAIAALVLLAKRRDGETTEWADLDEVDLAALVATLNREDHADGDAADPGADAPDS